jgi:hypothetical protein
MTELEYKTRVFIGSIKQAMEAATFLLDLEQDRINEQKKKEEREWKNGPDYSRFRKFVSNSSSNPNHRKSVLHNSNGY